MMPPVIHPMLGTVALRRHDGELAVARVDRVGRERGDDYVTDPAGNAGPRIACGVLTAPR